MWRIRECAALRFKLLLLLLLLYLPERGQFPVVGRAAPKANSKKVEQNFSASVQKKLGPAPALICTELHMKRVSRYTLLQPRPWEESRG